MDKNYISQLKHLLQATNLTQAALAERLGVTTAALSRWLHAHAKPHPQKIEAIGTLYKELIGFPSVTPEELSSVLQQAARFKIKSLWQQIASNQKLQDELLLEHTYNSTTIEGATFTKKETEAVIFDKSVIRDKSLVEHLEITNHAAVLSDILKQKCGEKISEEWIKGAHQSLMQGVRKDAGEYSKHLRAIRGVDIHLTHPKDIPEEMKHLIRDWNRSKKELADIGRFHVRFELIHPFGDGNGRVGRLIMAVQCLAANFPPVVIENSRKADYYEVLEYAQRESENPFILFLVSEMERTHAILRKYLH